MQSLIHNTRRFSKKVADRRTDLGHLAAGQRPEALFITCSDSRVVPALITGARPGELVELRTAGNIVPAYHPELVSGEAATIEYAVEVLKVKNIIVCGHSHCGAVGALVRAEDLTAVPTLRRWLADTGPHDHAPNSTDGEAITSAVQQHVLAQLDRLRHHPSVAERLKDRRLRLHGWFYAIDTGLVSVHRPETATFQPL